MRKHLVRPLTMTIVAVITTLSVFGYFAMERVVQSEKGKILAERGAAVSVLLQSTFTQELAAIKVLGAVANADPQDSQATFNAGAQQVLSTQMDTIAIASSDGHGGYRIDLSANSNLRSGQRITGSQLTLVRAIGVSLTGAATTWHEGNASFLGMGARVAGRIVYVTTRIDPDIAMSAAPPFDKLRGALYAGPVASPSSLLISTERGGALTGGLVEHTHFMVGDDQWTLYFAARDNLVGSSTADLPILVLLAGLSLALLVAAVVETLSRRRAYAERVAGERTRSLADANGELEEARAFMRHLSAAGPIVAFVLDAETLDASYVSPNVMRELRYTEGQATTPGFLRSHISSTDLAELRDAVATTADGEAGQRRQIEISMTRGDGESRWVSTTIAPIGSRQGASGSVIIYVLDVDARRRAEQAQAAAQAAADAANRSKSEFLSRMSHELRTPLNAVLGYAQLLDMDDLREDQQGPIDQILASGRHLLELINEVLDISRIEAGELSMSVEPVEVNEVLSSSIDMVQPEAAAAEIDIITTRNCGDFSVTADRQRLRQILLNLLSNAVKYNRLHGTVTVSCSQPDASTVRIAVTDTGRGIKPEQYDKVFAPFERLGDNPDAVEGTGIGLALSGRLANEMGGSLGFESTFGEGSTFWVDLPLAAVTAHDDSLEGDVAHFEPHSPSAPLRTVLHIEDNPTNLALIERVLKRVPGVDVISCTSGSVGLESALRNHPDLVLLDLHLPDLSGEEVLAALRADPITRDTPVIVITADATPGKVDRLIAAGATAYLTKPINIQELLDMVDSRVRT